MKRKTVIILFALFTTLLVVLSCTLPIYIVTSDASDSKSDDEEEEEEEEAIEAPTATVEPTVTSTPTTAITPVLVYLDGPWTIWEGIEEERLDIDFLQDGYSLVGNASTDDGHSLLYEGTISSDGTSVSGTWRSTRGTQGNFIMYLDSTYSVFGGNMGGGMPFCGNRLNSSKPSPCLR